MSLLDSELMYASIAGLATLFFVFGAMFPKAIEANPNRPWVARMDTTGARAGGIIVASTGDFATIEKSTTLKLPCRGKLPVQDFSKIAALVGAVISQEPSRNFGVGTCQDAVHYGVQVRWVDEKGALQESTAQTPLDSIVCRNKESVPELFYNLIVTLKQLRSEIAPHCTLSILPER